MPPPSKGGCTQVSGLPQFDDMGFESHDYDRKRTDGEALTRRKESRGSIDAHIERFVQDRSAGHTSRRGAGKTPKRGEAYAPGHAPFYRCFFSGSSLVDHILDGSLQAVSKFNFANKLNRLMFQHCSN